MWNGPKIHIAVWRKPRCVWPISVWFFLSLPNSSTHSSDRDICEKKRYTAIKAPGKGVISQREERQSWEASPVLWFQSEERVVVSPLCPRQKGCVVRRQARVML